MAALIDLTNVASDGYQGTSPRTIAGAVVASGDTRLLSFAGMSTTAGLPPSGITYAGNALNFIIDHLFTSSGNSDVSCWYLDTPPVGSASAILTNGVGFTGLGWGTIPIIGADLTRAPSAGTGAGTTSTSPACSAPAAGANDIQIAVMVTRAGAITAPGGNQVNVFTQAALNTGIISVSVDYILGANPGNFTWTTTSNDWSAIALTIFGVSSKQASMLSNRNPGPAINAPFNNNAFRSSVRSAGGIVNSGGIGVRSPFAKWMPIEFAVRLRTLQQRSLNVGNTRQNAANLTALAKAEANTNRAWARWNPALPYKLQVDWRRVPGYVPPIGTNH